jgi:hypothetical protein
MDFANMIIEHDKYMLLFKMVRTYKYGGVTHTIFMNQFKEFLEIVLQNGLTVPDNFICDAIIYKNLNCMQLLIDYNIDMKLAISSFKNTSESEKYIELLNKANITINELIPLQKMH